ncbi:hypothetical protein GJ496_004556 [Pomphorhynchus laevis]|nr:hypothetical protein GJ496_004556 [Pomphorhynchus laevis]
MQSILISDTTTMKRKCLLPLVDDPLICKLSRPSNYRPNSNNSRQLQENRFVCSDLKLLYDCWFNEFFSHDHFLFEVDELINSSKIISLCPSSSTHYRYKLLFARIDKARKNCQRTLDYNERPDLVRECVSYRAGKMGSINKATQTCKSIPYVLHESKIDQNIRNYEKALELRKQLYSNANETHIKSIGFTLQTSYSLVHATDFNSVSTSPLFWTDLFTISPHKQGISKLTTCPNALEEDIADEIIMNISQFQFNFKDRLELASAFYSLRQLRPFSQLSDKHSQIIDIKKRVMTAAVTYKDEDNLHRNYKLVKQLNGYRVVVKEVTDGIRPGYFLCMCVNAKIKGVLSVPFNNDSLCPFSSPSSASFVFISKSDAERFIRMVRSCPRYLGKPYMICP